MVPAQKRGGLKILGGFCITSLRHRNGQKDERAKGGLLNSFLFQCQVDTFRVGVT